MFGNFAIFDFFLISTICLNWQTYVQFAGISTHSCNAPKPSLSRSLNYYRDSALFLPLTLVLLLLFVVVLKLLLVVILALVKLI